MSLGPQSPSAAVRISCIPSHPRPSVSNFAAPDPAANPYHLAASALMAGLDGTEPDTDSPATRLR